MNRKLPVCLLAAFAMTAAASVAAAPLYAAETRPPQASKTTSARLNSPPSAQRRNIVLFAAESVELHVPEGWQVVEVPYGREIRVVVSPQSAGRTRHGMPKDGIWLTVHPRPSISASNAEELSQLMQLRLPLAAGEGIRTEVAESMEVSGREALVQHFTESTSNASARLLRRGFHLLAATDWGICELHAVAPEATFAKRRSEFERVVADLRLHQPKLRPQAPIDEVRDATAVLGAWKAFSSRMRLFGDGRIVINIDRRRKIAVDGQVAKPDAQLVGVFQARGDLLMVTWNDGSRLNFRWRRDGNDLLLTDHEGQTTQLVWLLE